MKCIYIKKGIGFVEFGFRLNSKYNVGLTWEDYLNNKYVELNNKQIQFRYENPGASIFDVWNCKLNSISDDEKFNLSKINKLGNNERLYTEAFSIIIKEDLVLLKTWFDQTSRDNILNVTIPRLRLENKNTILVENKELDINYLTIILLYTDLYEDDINKKYNENKENIDNLKTIEEVENYNIVYPDKLIFDIKSADFINKVNDYRRSIETKEVEESEETKATTMFTKFIINTLPLTDRQALSVKILYPNWEYFIGKKLEKDNKVQYNGLFYKLQKDIYPVLENQPPSIDTASIYYEINETNSGEKEIDEETGEETIDAIPYNNNMILDEGKYYSQYDIIYYCNRSTGVPVYNDLKDLIGIYVQLYNNN